MLFTLLKHTINSKLKIPCTLCIVLGAQRITHVKNTNFGQRPLHSRYGTHSGISALFKKVQKLAVFVYAVPS